MAAAACTPVFAVKAKRTRAKKLGRAAAEGAQGEDAVTAKAKKVGRMEFPNHPHSLRATYPTHLDCERCKRRRTREKAYAHKARLSGKAKAALAATQGAAL